MSESEAELVSEREQELLKVRNAHAQTLLQEQADAIRKKERENTELRERIVELEEEKRKG